MSGYLKSRGLAEAFGLMGAVDATVVGQRLRARRITGLEQTLSTLSYSEQLGRSDPRGVDFASRSRATYDFFSGASSLADFHQAGTIPPGPPPGPPPATAPIYYGNPVSGVSLGMQPKLEVDKLFSMNEGLIPAADNIDTTTAYPSVRGSDDPWATSKDIPYHSVVTSEEHKAWWLKYHGNTEPPPTRMTPLMQNEPSSSAMKAGRGVGAQSTEAIEPGDNSMLPTADGVMWGITGEVHEQLMEAYKACPEEVATRYRETRWALEELVAEKSSRPTQFSTTVTGGGLAPHNDRATMKDTHDSGMTFKGKKLTVA